jgi:hypothetical protein
MTFAARLLFCAGLAVALAGPARATTYHCAPGGSDNDDGIRSPWRTLQHAASEVRPGDTVLLADGTYPGGVVHHTSGTREKPITYQAEHRGRAVVRGGVIGFLIDNADWLVLDGLMVREAASRGVRVLVSHHLVVRHCTFCSNGIEGMITGYCNDLLIEDNESYGNGRGFHDGDDDFPPSKGHGIYVSSSGDRPIVRGNRCHDNGGCGIQVNGYGDPDIGGQLRGVLADHIITGAILTDNVLYRNGRGEDGGGAGINLQSVRDSILYNNLLYQNFAGGIACFADYAGPQWGCQNNRIVNNTIYFKADEGRYGLQFLEGSKGNLVRNNIIVAGRGPALEYDDTSGEPDSDFNVLYSASDSSHVVALASGDGDVTGGYSFAAWQKHGKDARSQSASPEKLFASVGGADFSLAQGSPAAGAGAPLTGALAIAPGRTTRPDIGWSPPVVETPAPPPAELKPASDGQQPAPGPADMGGTPPAEKRVDPQPTGGGATPAPSEPDPDDGDGDD